MFLMFTGQGSQKSFMAYDFYQKSQDARVLVEKFDNRLGYDISKIIFNEDQSQLNLTINTQPAILLNAMIIYNEICNKYGADFTKKIKFAAGHSVGEYCALCAAGGIDILDCAEILQERAKSMSAIPGGMIALLGATLSNVEKLLEKIEQKCEVSNDNGAGQFVLSGELPAIEYVEKHYQNFDIKRAVKLAVSGPFHSSLLESAKVKLSKKLCNYKFMDCVFPVISNVDVKSFAQDTMQERLLMQITSSVRWRETMEFVYSQNIRYFLEIGPTPILTNLAKRHMPDIEVLTISKLIDLSNLEKFL